MENRIKNSSVVADESPRTSETLLPCPLCLADRPQLSNNERRNFVIFCRACNIELEESNREGENALRLRWNTRGRACNSHEALVGALKLLVADVQDYEPWQRPCHALDVANAALSLAKEEVE